jgi:hypothetical protein
MEKLNSSHLKNEDLKEIKLKLNGIEEKASNIIKELNPFSFVAI